MRISPRVLIPTVLLAWPAVMVVLTTTTSAAAPHRAAAVAQGPGQATAADHETAVVQAFERSVREYVTLHRLLEGPLPPLQVSNDLDTVRAAIETFAARIRAARRTAGQGDLFTPDVARVLRKRIASCLTPEEIQAVLADHEPGQPIVVPPPLTANMAWPEGVPFTFVPPRLIATLPPLPPELQYRIIGRAVVLWDHHANLIVDVLPAAFPR